MIVSSTFYLVTMGALLLLCLLLSIMNATKGTFRNIKALLSVVLCGVLLHEIIRELCVLQRGAPFVTTPLRLIVFRAEYGVLGAYLLEVWKDVKNLLGQN